MKTSSRIPAVFAWLFVVAGSVSPLHAQTIYRIVGPDGRLTFSDKAPQDLAKASATTAGGKAVAAGEPGLPYELRQVVARYPVTLYAGASCGPCNAGRLLLQRRGVPFTEYAVNSNEDVEALQRISGDNSLPFLAIGGQKIKGFSESEWAQFLTAANYPMTSMLPATYRNAPTKPLVAVQKPPTAQEQADAQSKADEKSVANQPGTPAPVPLNATSPDNPVGIKF